MVHPGTHLTCDKSWVPVQNQWVPVKKKWVQNWKCLGLYVTRQLIWRQTPKLCITVYWNWNIVLLFWSTTKAKRKITATEITRMVYFYKYTCMLRSINRSLHPTGRMPWIILRLWGFLFVKDAACGGNKITVLHGYLRSEARYGDSYISITELNKIVHSHDHVLQSSR